MQPLISIVIPIYNTEKYLPKLVASVTSQGFPDFELLLIDDGSTDGCPAIIDDYAKKDPRIRAFHKPNAGTYTGYNMGIEQAQGKYIVFGGSDDLFDEQSLKIIARQAEEYDYDLILMNVATHACDKDQNIIRRNIQSSVMKERIRIIGKKNIENAWDTFFNLGLLRNPANAYRTTMMKNFRFRLDIYGADYLMNIVIADAIGSASCDPANLYHGLIYPSIQDERFNISSGKYYPYEHAMFNEFYERYKSLYQSWGTLNENVYRSLANTRLIQFDVELIKISAWNNTRPYDDKIANLVSYFDDVVVETTALLNNRPAIENKILNAIGMQIIDAEKTRSRRKKREHCITRLIHTKNTSNGNSGRLGDDIISILVDASNPYRLGLTLADQFFRDNPEAGDREAMEYLIIEEKARALILTGKYHQASDELILLFKMPFDEPEKYLLLALNCYSCGYLEDAAEAVSIGLDRYPEYGRLVRIADRIREASQPEEPNYGKERLSI